MRIGNPTNNEFFLELNKINEEIQNSFLKKISHETRSVSCDVMLGDSTTKKVETFDIKNVETFLGRFESKLDEWNSQGVTYSSDEDLRRIFIKSEIKLGNYILSLHISLQYHVLLYYKPIQRVIDLQKKLAELIDAGAIGIQIGNGFGPSASMDQTSHVSKIVKNRCSIKTVGGIKTFDQAIEIIEAGSTYIGTSFGFEITQEQKKKE